MQLSSYEDFIRAAQTQSEPQRLLFVFTKAMMPEKATADQQQRFGAGEGGNLEPVLCVDKLPDEVSDFNVLLEESKATGIEWDIAFAASMSGSVGFAPTPEQAEQPLKMMVESIKGGNVANFLAFNRKAELLRIL
ncbi:ribonucleotide reductase subunit alpha [Aliidiomarina halalkaliphila]|uniref:Ribonucleotide reductase subunit alpha n=1 Tax=Aliidiomarina halalkaliphila TaxID=2593535 RepID=A0A552X3P5_9GAMM|nr:ribonucleotide reductase subunit alpha [Aliidiomarina halalkaliphila]TRW49642.1 ribonucleotide reductase subunit alpha [Aliidiomarina halalkaliphila]